MKLPSLARQFFAELLGTFALVVFGDGAVAQVVLGAGVKGDPIFFGGFLNICFGYGLALMIGILVSGGVSGGHLNPAVTLAMVATRKLKLIQLPVYWAGQYLGAFLAALVLWGNFADAIHLNGGYTAGTRGIFASYPMNEQISTVTLAMDQMLGTALLLLIISAVTDGKNMKVNSSLVPLLIGLGLTAIHLSFGLNAGAAINPARDMGPRILTALVGWPDTFSAASHWFWIPWLLPHLGGVLGALIYSFLIEIHHPAEEVVLKH